VALLTVIRVLTDLCSNICLHTY